MTEKLLYVYARMTSATTFELKSEYTSIVFVCNAGTLVNMKLIGCFSHIMFPHLQFVIKYLRGREGDSNSNQDFYFSILALPLLLTLVAPIATSHIQQWPLRVYQQYIMLVFHISSV